MKRQVQPKDVANEQWLPTGLLNSQHDPIQNIQIILQLVQNILAMSTTFYAFLDDKHMSVQEVYQSPYSKNQCDLPSGAVVSLDQTFCQFVYRSSYPLVVTCADKDAQFQNLETTRDLNINSYVGVPLIRGDGTILGTLCGIDQETVHVTNEQIEMLTLLSHALVVGMERAATLRHREDQHGTLEAQMRDTLTGLMNRKAFDYSLQSAIIRAALDRKALSIIFTGINHLSHIHESFGSLIADEVLKSVGSCFEGILRDDDYLFRFNDEVLVALLPNTSGENARKIAERLQALLQGKPVTEDKDSTISLFHASRRPPLRVSFGIATYPADAASATDMVQRADAAMYHAQQNGEVIIQSASNLSPDTEHPNSASFTQTHFQDEQSVLALSAALSARDGETSDHADRLVRLTKEILIKLGHSEEEAYSAGIAAQLHDIGKVGISDAVLRKPGPLDDVEWQEMRRHPEIGRQILLECGGRLSDIGDIVAAHHERWDGGGYPAGLTGEEIPLAARVISVIDAFDAMTRDRLYRKAMSYNLAIIELQKHAGTQFDPLIVTTFLQIMGTQSQQQAA